MGADFMNHLDSLLLDEGCCVTLKSLAYQFGISSSEAKKLLEEYVKARQDGKGNLSITYFISGLSRNILHLKLVNGIDELEREKKMLENITATHVYAVQASRTETRCKAQTLWNTNNAKMLEIINNTDYGSNEFIQFGKNGLGAINCRNLDVAPPRKVSNSADSNSSLKPRHIGNTSKLTSVSTSVCFAQKRKEQEVKEEQQKTSISAEEFFKKEEEKEEVELDIINSTNNNKRGRNVIDSDGESGGEEVDSNSTRRKKLRPQLTEEEKQQRDAERKVREKERRAKRNEEVKREKEARKKAEAMESKARFAEKLGCDAMSSKNEGKTKIVRKLVQKEYMDEKGYLVTKEVLEDVEVPVEESSEHKTGNDKDKAAVEKSFSPAKNSSPPKPKGKAKQKNMFSFFKKQKK